MSLDVLCPLQMAADSSQLPAVALSCGVSLSHLDLRDSHCSLGVKRWRAQPSPGSSLHFIIKRGFLFTFWLFLYMWQPRCLFLPLPAPGITQILSSGLGLLHCEMGAACYSAALPASHLTCRSLSCFRLLVSNSEVRPHGYK